jgi:hypothetical protein
MMNKAMHQTMIDQLTVLANTIQNCLTKTLKKGIEEGCGTCILSTKVIFSDVPKRAIAFPID